MKKLLNSLLLSGLLLSLSAPVQAQDSLGSAVKEIFVKGSVSGESLFLVLGFEGAKSISQNSMRNIVDKEALVDIGSDSIEAVGNAASVFYDPETRSSDYVEAIGESAQYSKKHLPRILTSPWKSLKKIPQSYKVGLEKANEAYRNSSNPIVGATLWSANAVWVNVKGAYYLVIEAPTKTISEIAQTLIPIPGTIIGAPVLVGAGLVINLGFEALQLSYQLSKAVIASSISVGSYAYAALSTTVAAGVVTVGNVALHTTKLAGAIISFPFTYNKKAKTKVKTDINYTELSELTSFIQKNVATQELAKLGVNTSFSLNSLDNHPSYADRFYKSTITFKDLDNDRDAMKITVSINFNSDKKKQNIEISAATSSKHFKNIKKETKLSSKELKEEFKKSFSNALQNVAAKYIESKEVLDEAI